MPQAVVEDMGDDTLLGTTLAERYTLVGRVGAGGMGTVYRAEQAPMGRLVALKVLRRDLGNDPETVARFHREARALSQLKHPNTVTVFDFGQSADGLLYLAMELLEGEMLSARLKREGALPVPFAVRSAAGVLRSLDEAHVRGIIHRDLKPDNIFLARVHGRPDEDEVVKVVDFGIAKIRNPEPDSLDPLATQEGTVFGTPRYMSPEQAQGRSLDGRSDLYAVGVLLFHMLTGHPPFTEDDAVVVMANHIKVIPPRVREAAPERELPDALEELVARALAKDPADRPQSAAEFLTELEVAAQGLMDPARASRPSVTAETTALLPTQTPRRGGSLMPVTGIALLVVALVGALGALAGTSGAHDRELPPHQVAASLTDPEPANTAPPVTPVAAPTPVQAPSTQAPTLPATPAAPVAAEPQHTLVEPSPTPAAPNSPEVVEPAPMAPPTVGAPPAHNRTSGRHRIGPHRHRNHRPHTNTAPATPQPTATPPAPPRPPETYPIWTD